MKSTILKGGRMLCRTQPGQFLPGRERAHAGLFALCSAMQNIMAALGYPFTVQVRGVLTLHLAWIAYNSVVPRAFWVCAQGAVLCKFFALSVSQGAKLCKTLRCRKKPPTTGPRKARKAAPTARRASSQRLIDFFSMMQLQEERQMWNDDDVVACRSQQWRCDPRTYTPMG
jgi:hypothetical protein